MYKLRRLLKRLFSPITIMVVPHDSRQPYGFKLPSVGIVLMVLLWIGFSAYIINSAVETSRYNEMKESLNYYTSQFNELQSSMLKIRDAERELKSLLATGKRDALLERLGNDAGALNADDIKDQIKEAIERIAAIKEFLQQQKNLYLATPKGWPLQGRITSEFGKREDPSHGGMDNHTGIDISAPKGTEIKATADGIVSFSGWSQGNGNLVVIEHGMGYTTLYAHNSTNLVTDGQRVKRGDVIALVGATGRATGPHLHYEVWVKGIPQNPMKYISEVQNVSAKK
jgi:murein DD-endopeptidase MepM/ murein hydrolase activator NlpD